MQHIDKETISGNQLNIDALYKIAPSCFTEAKGEDGTVRKVVDFAKLRLLLGDNAVEDAPEVYDFTWVGKRAAMREAAAPIRKTLRPCPEESVDWDTTQNLYIEGDNLEVLKLLQNSYMGKVKMIYIDPPYNTGNDFVYHDDFSQSYDEYDEYYRNDDGDRYVKNTNSNGRFHSDWCSMIYARLMVARSLLSEDGVIFISIGEEECTNLTNICKEVFGESNQISIISRLMKSGGNNGDFFSPNIDYILVFAKCREFARQFKCDMSEDLIAKVYNKKETEGPRKGEKYRTMGLYQASLTLDRSVNARYYIKCPDGSLCIPPKDKRWRVVESSYEKMLQEGNIQFIKTNQSPLFDDKGNASEWNIYTKIWLKDRQEEGQTPTNFISKFENRHSAKELIALGIPFDFAKPSELIKYLIYIIKQDKDSLILDFFSGSATTAHAVMQLNAEDGGHRKFIMVQWPEETPDNSEAAKAGYRNICEIGKERIRRAGDKIKSNSTLTSLDLDTGFRVFKCDETNYKDVAFSPKDYSQESLDLFTDNIKEDRSDLDLLFDCMLRWGVQLSMPLSTTKVDGCTIHNVDDGNLVACFDGIVTEKVIDAIAAMSPVRVVFRDSSFTEASTKMNLYELFKQKCGWSDSDVKNNIRVI